MSPLMRSSQRHLDVVIHLIDQVVGEYLADKERNEALASVILQECQDLVRILETGLQTKATWPSAAGTTPASCCSASSEHARGSHEAATMSKVKTELTIPKAQGRTGARSLE